MIATLDLLRATDDRASPASTASAWCAKRLALGLTAAGMASAGELVLSMAAMIRIREIDGADQIAVGEPAS